MISVKVQELGISQGVSPFMEWMQTCNVASLRTIVTLVSVNLAGVTLEQCQRIWT